MTRHAQATRQVFWAVPAPQKVELWSGLIRGYLTADKLSPGARRLRRPPPGRAARGRRREQARRAIVVGLRLHVQQIGKSLAAARRRAACRGHAPAGFRAHRRRPLFARAHCRACKLNEPVRLALRWWLDALERDLSQARRWDQAQRSEGAVARGRALGAARPSGHLPRSSPTRAGRQPASGRCSASMARFCTQAASCPKKRKRGSPPGGISRSPGWNSWPLRSRSQRGKARAVAHQGTRAFVRLSTARRPASGPRHRGVERQCCRRGFAPQGQREGLGSHVHRARALATGGRPACGAVDLPRRHEVQSSRRALARRFRADATPRCELERASARARVPVRERVGRLAASQAVLTETSALA